jgi:hypothetical protein
MFARLNPAPVQLPPLRTRGRSTIRRTTFGPKQRASTHRDSTQKKPSNSQAAPLALQAVEPTEAPAHLSAIPGQMKPAGDANANACSCDAEAPFKSEVATTSCTRPSVLVTSKPRRSVCSASPCLGGGNTASTSATTARAQNQQAPAHKQAATSKLGQHSSRSSPYDLTNNSAVPPSASTSGTVPPRMGTKSAAHAHLSDSKAPADAGAKDEQDEQVLAGVQAGRVEQTRVRKNFCQVLTPYTVIRILVSFSHFS